MARRWFDLLRLALRELLSLFGNRYRKLQPTPLKLGTSLMLVMFPTGVLLTRRADATSQHLADYANGFFMLGLGLVLAYLYIDRFNERAHRQQYREVNGTLVQAVDDVNNALVGYSFRRLLEVPSDALREREEGLLAAFVEHSQEYFEANRLEVLEHYKDTFDAALQEKHQYLKYKHQVGASYVIFTEQQAVEIVETCRPLIERLNTGITRLLSSRLKPEVIEDLVVFDTVITNIFYTFVAHEAKFTSKTLFVDKAEKSFEMWLILKNLFHHASLFVFVLDGMLEGTAYRERRRRGEHDHWTTTASERRMD